MKEDHTQSISMLILFTMLRNKNGSFLTKKYWFAFHRQFLLSHLFFVNEYHLTYFIKTSKKRLNSR